MHSYVDDERSIIDACVIYVRPRHHVQLCKSISIIDNQLAAMIEMK